MNAKRKTKRSIWALIGKLLWALFSLVLKVAAALGSRWARKKIDAHRAERERGRKGAVRRLVHPRR